MQIRMMPVVFGDAGTLVEEPDARHEVLDHPVLADALSVAGQPPASELLELLAGLVGGVWLDASFARQALLLA
jgi:hypothetical protein